jgi:hypothetical protein
VCRFCGYRAGYFGPGLASLSAQIRFEIEDFRLDPVFGPLLAQPSGPCGALGVGFGAREGCSERAVTRDAEFEQRCSISARMCAIVVSAELSHTLKVLDRGRNAQKPYHNWSESVRAGLWAPPWVLLAWLRPVWGPIWVQNRRVPAGFVKVLGALIAQPSPDCITSIINVRFGFSRSPKAPEQLRRPPLHTCGPTGHSSKFDIVEKTLHLNCCRFETAKHKTETSNT